MYVIIDWHILSDGNPKKNQSKAKAFFKKMSNKYRKEKHVFYEICNEPNGGVQWKTIKSYAKSVIKVIRKADKNAVVLSVRRPGVRMLIWRQNLRSKEKTLCMPFIFMQRRMAMICAPK